MKKYIGIIKELFKNIKSILGLPKHVQEARKFAIYKWSYKWKSGMGLKTLCTVTHPPFCLCICIAL